MKKIYFITGNKGKVIEAKNKFSEIGIEVIQKNFGYPEIQTNSLEEVAIYGVKHIQNHFDKPFILEDAGLFIEQLNGFPGVYSAFVFYSIGCKGVLKLMENSKNRKATFRSVFAYGEQNKKQKIFVGESNGIITQKEKGNNGFGYDPIFIPNSETRTFAEMETGEKNIFSHRGKSLEKLIDFFKIQ